ncbi:MAG: shikimate dehydrogenase [Chloroflexi bacterium]|nr:shikimate dehydrogenase [Chloroflexota bacterium]
MKQYLAIIGYPLRHSISPDFQQAALDSYGLDMEYQAWETNPSQLAAAIGELRYPRNLGANVTIPFKEEVLPMLDQVDEMADEIGAVNTIAKCDGMLTGYNTDAAGFLRALSEDREFDAREKAAVVLGAGGVARAVCHSLLNAGISRLTLANRSVTRAEELAEALQDIIARKALQVEIDAVALDVSANSALSDCDLIVNCTPLGMKHGGQEKKSPLQADQIPAHALVYDVVYNPEVTPLLKEAARAGARTLSGLPMLVYQGAAAFELWTGKEAPLGVMFEAARAALR